MSTVIVINDQGERVHAVIYRESPDGSGRLDLLIPTVDSATRQVKWFGADKCAHGVEYVNEGEDPSILGKRERDAFHPTEEFTQPVDATSEIDNTTPATTLPPKKNKHDKQGKN